MIRGLAGLAGLVALGACGDNAYREEVFTAVSGSRLALQWYGYPDGTRQPAPAEFYDTQQHTRCTPQRWTDDVVRCVPVAEDAVYRDAACTELVGRGVTIDDPTHFIDHEWLGEVRRPSRVFHAADDLDTVTQFFEKQGGDCLGPFVSPADTVYYALGGEVTAGEMIALRDVEVGDGRIGLRVRETDDGLRVPVGLRDRELDVDCTAVSRADGSAWCEPIGAAPSEHFRDPACAEPVVLVAEGAPVPAAARVVEPSGCPSFHAVGEEVTSTLYRRDGDACVPASGFPGARVFAVAAPLELPELGRRVEALAGRRLQRLVLSDGELRFFGDRLFDTAMRAECERFRFGSGLEDLPRCIPATLAPATTLYTATCAVATPVAELPASACERPAFAVSGSGRIAIHAIGDPVSSPLFRRNFDQCSPYQAAPGAVVHALGPPLEPTAFAGARYFGER